MSDDKEYIEVECINPKCKKVSVFSIPKSLSTCKNCGTKLPLSKLKKSSIATSGKVIFLALGVGYSVAEAPELFQTKDEIILIYERMNACMSEARYYREQRDICACAFSKTYESHKFFSDIKDIYRENIRKCRD
ncbi:hypothetical protein EV697_10569 [Bisgaardia hudsonensis]|uniref:Uncharacterized protein n=1 Tax=Bisgaardia hudsonensis TaxID=109472 RepID=A0A4R2MWN0_9PAST|nr:hypothetical protein [Bisgaardia hudsonensis]QLB13625.1 hypothetical protein A6A11_08405 [Bisgaardia hudsonensis]TCP11957.1 hypothetical protein EV697_10569 [Bisgaardia hudsonensis]